jgi:hypothetical protein
VGERFNVSKFEISMLVRLKTAADNSGKKVSSRARKVVAGEGENLHHDG